MANEFKFKATGAFSWTVPSGVTKVDILIVGGGGSAGRGDFLRAAGGGGGGEVRWLQGVAVTPGMTLNGTVGEGGQPTSSQTGNDGQNSSFDGTIALGGGAGGGSGNGQDGGSGGGGSSSFSGINAGGAAIGSGIGNSGGNNADVSGWGTPAGGGGGAGSAGQDAAADKSGDGGAGIDISDFANDGDGGWFAGGGGGGGTDDGPAGQGSQGGGAAGGAVDVAGADAMPNTGGGGGGSGKSSNDFPSGAGGSGVVLIRNADPVISLDRKTNNSLEVSWTNIDGANGDADDWTVEASQNGSVVDTFTATQESAEITGLSPNTSTDITITGSDSTGQGTPFTETLTTSPAEAPNETPDASVAVGLQTMSVSWTLQNNVDSYISELRGVNGRVFQSVQAFTTSAEFVGEPFTEYEIAIIPSNEFGTGPAALLSVSTEPWLDGAAVDLVFDGTPTPAQVPIPVDNSLGLAGTVKDESGNGLENRNVHIYRRDSGELQATVVSGTGGSFEWTGADPNAEYFVVSINPADSAGDFTPSAANRIDAVVI